MVTNDTLYTKHQIMANGLAFGFLLEARQSWWCGELMEYFSVDVLF